MTRMEFEPMPLTRLQYASSRMKKEESHLREARPQVLYNITSSRKKRRDGSPCIRIRSYGKPEKPQLGPMKVANECVRL